MKSINLTVSKLSILKLILYVLSFLYIYTPPFKIFPFTPSYIITFISVLYIIICEPSTFMRFISNKNIFVIITLSLFIIFYSIFWDLASTFPKEISFTNKNSVKNILILFQSFFVSFFFFSVFKKHLKYDIYDILHFFVSLATIQSVFVVLMLISPQFREFSFLNLMRFSDNSKELHPLLWQIRSFGYSSQYLFAYPIFQGLTIIFSITLSIRKSLKYLIPIPLLIISIIFNARVGFLPLIIYPILLITGTVILLKIKYINRLLKIIGIASIIAVIAVSILFQSDFFVNYAGTIEWAFSAFEIGENQTTSILLDSHIFFPNSTFSIVFGQGRYLFMNPADSLSADPGYTNYLFFGGFIYVFLVSLFFILISTLAYSKTQDFHIRVLIISILITILVVNFKGLAFQGNSLINGFLNFVFYIILENSRNIQRIINNKEIDFLAV